VCMRRHRLHPVRVVVEASPNLLRTGLEIAQGRRTPPPRMPRRR
jgi:hypothetical protein